jgi:hypothetical protein
VAPSTCDIQPSPGLWYSFVGIDGVVTSVMSCRSADDVWNGAATVHVYAGSCVGASSGNIWEPSIQLQCISTMTVRPCDTVPFGIATKAGVTYYLLVQAQEANYAFNMTLLPTSRSTSAAAFPSNDVCAKAAPLTVGTTVMRNNFTLATSDDCSCGNVTRVSSRGLWFSFVGTGNKLWADVCGGSTPELVKQVSIYKGASCGSLKCVAGSTAPCPYPYSVPQLFVFDTEVGTTYYMLVQNRQGEIPRGEPPSSIFNAAIKDAPLPPVNDVCSKATPTSIGSTLAGDLALATSDHDEVSTVCGNNDNVYGNAYSMSNPPHMPGVWFRFVGMGGKVRVTSNCATGYSTTNIHVYKATTTASSSCGSSLQCVTGFGSYCDLEGGTTYYNVFNFTADVGSTYYLLVRKSALGDASGKFEVQLEAIASGAFDKFPIESVVPKRCVVTPPSPIPVVRPSPVLIIPPSPVAAVPPSPAAAVSPSTASSPRSPTGQDPSIGSGPVPAPAPAVSGPGAPNPAPMSPQPLSLPQSPSSQSSAPVQRPKCRRLGCRIRRLLRALFGIFT